MASSSTLAPTLVGRSRELAVLDELLESLCVGRSAVLVVRGEAGMGKTSLLEYLVSRASGLRVARIVAAESEIELAYAGLHQLCSPMLDSLEALPTPQRHALAVALGLRESSPPDPFLVALATLNLLGLYLHILAEMSSGNDRVPDRRSACLAGVVSKRCVTELDCARDLVGSDVLAEECLQ